MTIKVRPLTHRPALKMARRPAGYHSSAAFVADRGKYQRQEEDVDVVIHPQSLNSENERQDAIETLAGALRGGARLLVAGSPPGTFVNFRRDARVVLWPSSEAGRLDGQRVVPADIGAVLFTKMLSHALSDNVVKQARDRGLVAVGPLSDGTARRIIAAVLARLGTKLVGESPDQIIMDDVEPAVVLPPVVAEPIEEEQAMGKMADVAVVPAKAPDGLGLVALIDDAIAQLQLVREQAVAVESKAAMTEADAATLRQLRALLGRG